MTRRIFSAVLTFFVLTASSVFAKNIGVQIVQHSPDMIEPSETSSIIEQTIIDMFFESGHIVSTSPVYVTSDREADEADLVKTMKENKEGGMEVLIRVQVNFDVDNLTNPQVPLLKNIKNAQWIIYSMETDEVLDKGKLKAPKATRENNNEEGIIAFANDVAMKISGNLAGK